jgi:hypothetical protein
MACGGKMSRGKGEDGQSGKAEFASRLTKTIADEKVAL